MAQLIKLSEYISRYELDLSRYISQFIRLKKKHWDHIYEKWQSGEWMEWEFVKNENDIPEKQGFLQKIKGAFVKEEPALEEVEVKGIPFFPGFEHDIILSEQRQLDFFQRAKSEQELKQQFLDYLFRFQIKWASSTIQEKSFVHSHYYHDEKLKYFLQSFPDHYLLFYEPVFVLKKAPVELEILLLTPTDIWCLSFIEHEKDVAYIGSNGNFWTMKWLNKEKKVLNPVMSVNRMEKIVKRIFTLHDIDLPICKAIISRNGFIDYPNASSDLLLLDQRNYSEWYQRLRNMSSPVKMMQIRATKVLLEYCHTASFRRPDWEVETQGVNLDN